MNSHALAVLEAAQANAQQAEPVKASPSVRLALAWLVLNGVAEVRQAISFYEALTKPPMRPEPHLRWTYDFCRRRDEQIALDRWRIVAGERQSQGGKVEFARAWAPVGRCKRFAHRASKCRFFSPPPP